MDLIHIPGSRIVEVGKLAWATPDVDILAFGESDQPSPFAAHAAAKAALDEGLTTYQDVRGMPALRAALADYETALHAKPVTEDRIQVTASGMAAVSVALMAIVKAGQRVVLHTPAWPNVGNAALLRGAVVDEIGLDERPGGGFMLDLARLDAMLDGARAFILNSPNNPTGWTATLAELRDILEICRRRGVWLISDEVYSRLVYDGTEAAPSLLDIAEQDDRVIVCNSFSKTWVMTGWRLGWMTVPAGTRDGISDIVEVVHSTVAPFIQRAGIAAIADTASVAAFRAHCAQGREIAGQALAGLNGVRYAAPPGAFYAFIGIEGLTDSLGFARRLVVDHKVAVAPGIAFGAAGEGHLRICFAQSEQRLERAVHRLREGLQQLT
jgi:aspartate aminotransferase